MKCKLILSRFKAHKTLLLTKPYSATSYCGNVYHIPWLPFQQRIMSHCSPNLCLFSQLAPSSCQFCSLCWIWSLPPSLPLQTYWYASCLAFIDDDVFSKRFSQKILDILQNMFTTSHEESHLSLQLWLQSSQLYRTKNH